MINRFTMPMKAPTRRLGATTLLGSIGLAVFLVACQDPERIVSPADGPTPPATPRFTEGSGSRSTLIGRATFAEGFKVKRKTGDWEVDIKAKDPLDVAVQSITFQAGAQSGWHRHPGPVFIQVKSGTMTFYESDDPACVGIVRTAGQGYLDTGEHAHIARNESGAPATNIVTYFAPPGSTLRIDAPAPGNCSF
ncbi:MAG: hypothetical protein ACR2GK_12230 [Gemmatimonadaceae bacterium]